MSAYLCGVLLVFSNDISQLCLVLVFSNGV